SRHPCFRCLRAAHKGCALRNHWLEIPNSEKYMLCDRCQDNPGLALPTAMRGFKLPNPPLTRWLIPALPKKTVKKVTADGVSNPARGVGASIAKERREGLQKVVDAAISAAASLERPQGMSNEDYARLVAESAVFSLTGRK
ncbi:hypothetical protein KIPB_015734, partial [Kipferlia bialata]